MEENLRERAREHGLQPVRCDTCDASSRGPDGRPPELRGNGSPLASDERFDARGRRLDAVPPAPGSLAAAAEPHRMSAGVCQIAL